MNNPSEGKDSSLVQCILKELAEELSPYGFDISPFLSGWYDANTSSKVRLGSDLTPHEDCLCICLLSNPQMFEKTFIPTVFDWCKESGIESLDNVLKCLKTRFCGSRFLPGSDDPFDWTVFIRLQKALSSSVQKLKLNLTPDESTKLNNAEWIPDYAIRPVTRLPYVHVQTAGHVSGMAYFHQPSDSIKKKCSSYSGVSLHPYYGGWFGFRGIYIFPNLRYPTLPRQNPLSPIYFENEQLPDELLEHVLHAYNCCWNENKWRDYKLPDTIDHRYSLNALAYFSTSPSERVQFVRNLFARYKNTDQ
ncbi:unnamed protein product [Schistosoma margrebowiei]|uniref:Cyanocobalamin reductase (cyanide-eliminating) n=1 Tax=Schistosoma margrebowiei TaxID=48269 RepID=A0AA84ZT32_9TREM|nr:unnamed protein product [Schistosoma margrebowiei]CAH8490896.1 unnamed protein product [Schistosoma margrebowiei]